MINSDILKRIFTPFFGTVEDIDDPKKQGRVRVRIYGVHSDKTIPNDQTGKGIPPTDLPWAKTLTDSGVHGFGNNHHLVSGSWVFGYAVDNDVFNDLIILGAIGGVPENENPNPSAPPTAFHGQDGKWPDKEFLHEPDVSRLARGELGYKKDHWMPAPTIRDKDLKRAVRTAGSGSWSEKSSGYAAKYPHNWTFETPGRHTVEYDDTPGAERITIWHGKKHSYIDLKSDGSIQTKSYGDNFCITMGDNNLYAQGEVNITADGDVNVLASRDVNVESASDINVRAASQITATAGGQISINSSASVAIEAAGDVSITAAGMCSVTASGDCAITAGAAVTITASAACTITASAACTITAGAVVAITAAAVIGLNAPIIEVAGELVYV